MNPEQIRTIAIHLPQFHPVPENDAWWGKGFTEWTNVTKATPLFKDHYQPHLPADLGFYDLRLPEARQAQAELAAEYGITGFCYYHYWFNGRRILERPVEEILKSGKPDFPFMLCWANENWTRVWDGGEKDVLLEQRYSSDDDRAHIRDLLPIFRDPRYIRINDKPVFAIYKSTLFPDMAQTIKIWREEAAKAGMELYLLRFESLGISGAEYLLPGFDAAVEFQPQVNFESVAPRGLRHGFTWNKLVQSLRQRAGKMSKTTSSVLGSKPPEGNIHSYAEHVEKSLRRCAIAPAYKRYPGVTPGWDNSPRRKKNFLILQGSTPTLFEHWVGQTLKHFRPYSQQENLFFINAWNEWAEGNHLEPCQKWGRAYLEGLKRALQTGGTRPLADQRNEEQG